MCPCNSKNSMKLINISIWILIFILISNISFTYLSNPNTIENIIGFITFILFGVITIKTEFFTTFNKTKKDEN